MSSTKELFQLVKSLEKNEVIYFKKEIKGFQNNPESTNYIILLDQIIKSKTDNEKEIKDRLPKKIVKNYSRIKGYLFKQILKSLRRYHSEKDPKIIIYNHLIDIHLLLKKGLNTQAEKVLRKIEKQLQNSGQHGIEVITTKLNYMIDSKSDSFGALNTLADKSLTISKTIEAGAQLIKLLCEVKLDIETKQNKNVDVLKSLSLIDSKIIDQHYDLQIHKNTILMLHYEKMGAFDNAHVCAKKNVEINREICKGKEEGGVLMFKALYNQFLYAAMSKNYNSMESIEIEMGNHLLTKGVFEKGKELDYHKFLYNFCKAQLILESPKCNYEIDVFETEIIPLYKKTNIPHFNINGVMVQFFCYYYFITENLKEFQKWMKEVKEYSFKMKEYEYFFQKKIFEIILLIQSSDDPKWISVEIQNLKKLKNNHSISTSPLEEKIIKVVSKELDPNLMMKSLLKIYDAETNVESTKFEIVFRKWILNNTGNF